MAGIDQIKTIVIVLMENRSFDHMLGYLSLAVHLFFFILGVVPRFETAEA